VYELTLINNLIEEQLVRGHFRWLANFSEIQRDFAVEDTIFQVYATGGLREKGFLLSRVYSTMVTPNYKIHFLLFSAPEIAPANVKKMILALKRKFGPEDWIFLVLAQGTPIGESLRSSIESVDDKTVGVCGYGLGQKDFAISNTVLGRGLSKQLKLNEAKFEDFDVPNFLKSFTLTFAAGVGLLVFLALSGFQQAISPITLMILAVLSVVIGQVVYKSRYHTSIQISGKGFMLREGNKIKERKWTDFQDVSVAISGSLETFLRLKSKDETIDLPLTRTGMPRRETYNIVKHLVKRK
jgi:hypothetical protein